MNKNKIRVNNMGGENLNHLHGCLTSFSFLINNNRKLDLNRLFCKYWINKEVILTMNLRLFAKNVNEIKKDVLLFPINLKI